MNREKRERERRADTPVRRSSHLSVIEICLELLDGPFTEETGCLHEVDERMQISECPGEVAGVGGSRSTFDEWRVVGDYSSALKVWHLLVLFLRIFTCAAPLSLKQFKECWGPNWITIGVDTIHHRVVHMHQIVQ